MRCMRRLLRGAAVLTVRRGATLQAPYARLLSTAADGNAPRDKPKLAWSDSAVAAHVTRNVVRQLRDAKAPPVQARETLQAELRQLKDLGCDVWSQSWSAAMQYFTKTRGDLKAAEREAQMLFDACIADGVEPDQQLYGALVSSMRNYKNRRIVFDFMVLDGVDPSEEIVRTVLAACRGKTGRHKAESLFAFMNHEGIAPSLTIWTDLMRLYAMYRDLPGVCDVLLRMRQAGVPASCTVYSLFMDTCAKHVLNQRDDAFSLAEHSFRQAADDGLQLDARVHTALLRVYAAAGAHNRSRALVKKWVAESGYAPSAMLWEHRRALIQGEGDAKQASAIKRTVRRRFLKLLEAQPERVRRRFARARERGRKGRAQATSVSSSRFAVRDALAQTPAIKLKTRGWALETLSSQEKRFEAGTALPGKRVLKRTARKDEDDDDEDSDTIAQPPPADQPSSFEGRLRAVSRNTVRVGK